MVPVSVVVDCGLWVQALRFRRRGPSEGTDQIRAGIHANGPAADTIAAMRREPGAAGRTAGADPAGAWIKEWRRLIPPPGVWWRKSAFDLARARRTNRLRPWRWLTEPVATFRVWLATGRLSPAVRNRWNRRAEGAAAADPLLSALDPHQRRAAVCFEDRAMVTAGAGSGKTRTMVARAGYAARRLGTPPEAVAFITFTNKATEEIRQRTRERLPGLQVGTLHQLARRVLKLVDGRTVHLSPMAEDDGLRLRRIAGWIREEINRDPGPVQRLLPSRCGRRPSASQHVVVFVLVVFVLVVKVVVCHAPIPCPVGGSASLHIPRRCSASATAVGDGDDAAERSGAALPGLGPMTMRCTTTTTRLP